MLNRCFLFLTSIGLLTVAALLAPSIEKEAIPQYRIVADWPTLPPGVKLGQTTGVAVDSADRVYVFHRGKKAPIMVVDREGKFLRSWGEGLFKVPHGLKIDADGNVWVTDIGHHLVQKFTPQGKLLLTLGTKGKPGVGKNQFNKPADTAVDAEGNIYVADGYGNNRIVKFSKDGKFLKEWGKRGIRPGEFHLPHGVLVHQGHIIVADRENDRVQIFDRDGKFLSMWKKPGAPFGLLPLGEKNWVLADGRANEVHVLDDKGNIVGRFGMKGKGQGEFNLPHGICTDSRGALYVTEIQGKRIQKFAAK